MGISTLHDAEVPLIVVQFADAVERVERPRACPLCGRCSGYGIRSASRVPTGTELEVVFQCGDERCRRHFIGYYSARSKPSLIALKPIYTDIDGSLSAISLAAARVFAEAETAREAGLVHLACQGYRAAIEALATALAAKSDEELVKAADALKQAQREASPPLSAAVPHYMGWGKV